ncbi:hypothetical protein D9758_009983 [Tetrapyrgos nigripes]|uniref:non-specific serine/threonine protein kinase n=1 Tax=Tetrapyrgos nigripes TaxID=182062 RepID=A0A8H5CQQ5_9AGAR|nr:hypothetical protein D9758_009983 [Tetrapyrgos nigripes]
MLKSNMDTAPSRRPPVRVDQDGPWSVSVAESPHDPRSYSLYIKTPTHNLTLTRSIVEIVELDHKLRESTLPNTKLPNFPLDPATLPAPTPKRKSAFLNTLSRLASPTSNKSAKHSTSITASKRPTNGGTPVASPSTESSDPFQSFSASSALLNAALPTPSANSTALAAYFTTLSNSTGVRQARVWKRFVRVRTDDLESVRVERPLKHVRSDLAAHLGMTKDKKERKKEVQPVVTPEEIEKEQLEKNTDVEDVSPQPDVKADEMEVDIQATTSPTTETPTAAKATDKVIDITTPRASEDEPRTPLPQPSTLVPSAAELDSAPSPAADSEAQTSTTSTRVPRSQSADPDRRMSRAYLSSSVSGSQTETSQTETGDESSSVSTSRHPGTRKKKGTTSAPGASSDSASASQPTSKEGKTRKSQRKVIIDDFEMLRVLGKGCAGKVLLVRHKATTDLYAMKAITKRHVLAHQELQHTLTEQAVLRRMSAAENAGEGVKDPFVVKLWWSFHDKENLFLVMDFHPGGDLATQLARWGRLGRDRARFYAAEIVEGVEGLHAMGVIYRDLKPENILIGADGHIVLTDFGLSKEFPAKRAGVNGMNAKSAEVSGVPTAPPTPSGTRNPNEFMSAPWSSPSKDLPSTQMDQTTTFCGTAEYLAPEVIQGLPYSYEVDWWSFGTMLFEMLTGITPFWANNHADMYMRVLQDELQFPDDRAIDQDTKSLLRGLLQRNPVLRICEPRIKRHPYFSMIDWSHVYYKRYIPPYIPPIDPSNASDTQNFDDTFLDMEPVLDDVQDDEEGQDHTDTDDNNENTDTDRTDDDGDEANTTPSQSRSSSAVRPKKAAAAAGGEAADDSVDVFDGYSFKGRHSVLIGSDEEEESEEETDEETDEEEFEGGEIDLSQPPQPKAKPEPELQHRESEQPNQPVPDDVTEEEDVGPKTPEARPVALPPDDSEPVQDEAAATPAKDEATSGAVEPVVETKPRKSKELSGVTEVKEKTEKEAKEAKEKDTKAKPTPPAKTPPAPPAKTNRSTRPRKERSGVPALDKYLSDAPEDDGTTERDDFDDEDDDWDFVEAVDGEERNGARGTSLFARGVVDKYKLAVFSRKTSTPSKYRNGLGSRSASGMSYGSGMSTPPREANEAEGGSPSPSQKRGRNPGLTFRKHPRQFLRPKSPPSSYSPKSSSGTARSSIPSSLAGSNSNTLSSMTSMSTQLSSTSSPANGSGTLAGTQNHSLKSKESAISMGGQSHSSDQSNPDVVTDVPSPSEEPEAVKGQPKNNKLKKYKENAEKMLSLFSASPKQPQPQQQAQQ